VAPVAAHHLNAPAVLALIQTPGRRAFALIESLFDRAFTPAHNPLYQLGALSFFFFWIDIASGLYLYAVFDTSVFGAWESVEWITHENWYLAGVMRSLHRYSSDAMVVTVIAHLSREFFLDRLRGFRWFSWISGVPLLWLMFSSGINGYWLVWDKLAQYVAIATAEFMDRLPLFAAPMAANFLNESTVSDRFFSLLVFLHIGIPLALLLGMWFHIQRISRPRVNPPRTVMIGSALALLALSAVRPALSQPEANLDVVASQVDLDWFYLWIFPVVERIGAGKGWLLLGGLTLLLSVLPWLPPLRKRPVAVVDLDNCNGCARCYADCPYSAILMQPRSDGKPYAQEAVVNEGLCASCGLCVGACPTATPFRRAGELVPGIDLPPLTVKALREQALAAGGRLQGQARVLVYGCEHGPSLAKLADDQTEVLRVACPGALPPPLFDFVLSRRLADAIVLTGCRDGDCRHRFGLDWTEQRIAGERDPHLRARVPREQIVRAWVGPDGAGRLRRQIAALRVRLADQEADKS